MELLIVFLLAVIAIGVAPAIMGAIGQAIAAILEFVFLAAIPSAILIFAAAMAIAAAGDFDPYSGRPNPGMIAVHGGLAFLLAFLGIWIFTEIAGKKHPKDGHRLR